MKLWNDFLETSQKGLNETFFDEMSRLAFNTDTFRCQLECDQCTRIKANGLRCRSRVCFGIPVC